MGCDACCWSLCTAHHWPPSGTVNHRIRWLLHFHLLPRHHSRHFCCSVVSISGSSVNLFVFDVTQATCDIKPGMINDRLVRQSTADDTVGRLSIRWSYRVLFENFISARANINLTRRLNISRSVHDAKGTLYCSHNRPAFCSSHVCQGHHAPAASRVNRSTGHHSPNILWTIYFASKPFRPTAMQFCVVAAELSQLQKVTATARGR